MNELWHFNITASSWSLINSSDAVPLAAVGHSAHCIDDSMFVIFGHHPVYGYLNSVQRYDFGMIAVSILLRLVSTLLRRLIQLGDFLGKITTTNGTRARHMHPIEKCPFPLYSQLAPTTTSSRPIFHRTFSI